MTESRTARRTTELLNAENRSLTITLVALITMIAFENTAVSTAMPDVASDLGAVRSYGLAFSVLLTTQLAGIVLAGVWTDRNGSLPPLLTGQLLFAIGCAMCGLASSYPFFLLGRAVAGAGAGLVVVAAYVVVGRAFPNRLRPQVFSAFSAAWVLPALLGPPLAAWLTTTFSWHSVFWGVVLPVAVAIAATLTRRGQIKAADAGVAASSRSHAAHRRAALLGLAIAGAAGAMQWGTYDLTFVWSPQTVVAVLGGIGLVVIAPILLPAGMWTLRRGLPSVLFARFVFPAAFFGTTAYLPLMLTTERGLSLGQAGVVLAIGSLGWSAGSILQGLGRFTGVRDTLVTVGAAGLTAGLVGVVTVALAGWTPWLIGGALVIAGFGMGLGMSSQSVLALALSDPADHGEVSSSLQLSDVLGAVVGIAVAGAVLAGMYVGEGRNVAAFITMWTGLAVVAALGIAAGRRISS